MVGGNALLGSSGGGYGLGLDGLAWYCGNTLSEGPKPPRQLQANTFGLYDIHGNVWEWCQDGWSEYPSEDVTAPVGSGAGCNVIRGGDWQSIPIELRSQHRGNSYSPSVSQSVGVRLVRTADQAFFFPLASRSLPSGRPWLADLSTENRHRQERSAAACMRDR